MTHRDPGQMDLLHGLDMKESGMTQAIDHAELPWKDRFDLTVRRLADAGVPFTSEDVIAHVGLPTGKINLHRNNAVGAMMNAAAKRKIIRKTGRHVPSKRTASHGAELTEWVGIPWRRR